MQKKCRASLVSSAVDVITLSKPLKLRMHIQDLFQGQSVLE